VAGTYRFSRFPKQTVPRLRATKKASLYGKPFIGATFAADLISLTGNTTQRGKDNKAFADHPQNGVYFREFSAGEAILMPSHIFRLLLTGEPLPVF
jgi:hypothetical protein